MSGDTKGALQAVPGLIGGSLALTGVLVGPKHAAAGWTLCIIGALSILGGVAWSMVDPAQGARQLGTTQPR